jgi:hypothetical protein
MIIIVDSALKTLFRNLFGKKSYFKIHPGSDWEDGDLKRKN